MVYSNYMYVCTYIFIYSDWITNQQTEPTFGVAISHCYVCLLTLDVVNQAKTKQNLLTGSIPDHYSRGYCQILPTCEYPNIEKYEYH